MACGPIALTPQTITTALSLLGQPAGLPAELSLVMKGAQPEMRIEGICESGRVTGFFVERYFDTKTPITREVELDDGEVDEQTAYITTPADGRVVQKVTVKLDSEYKLGGYYAEALCGGNNPNAAVCTNYLPTIQSLGLGASQGKHADWMQNFVPEVEAGGEYVFVSAAEYPQVRKDAEEKKKTADTPPPVPSTVPTVTPSVMPTILPPPAPSSVAPAASTNPPSAKTDSSEEWINPLTVGLMGLGALLGAATAASLLKLRSSRQQNRKLRKRIQTLDLSPAEKTPARKKVSRPNNPHAEAAIRRDQIGDDPIPSARERLQHRKDPDEENMDDVLADLEASRKTHSQIEPE